MITEKAIQELGEIVKAKLKADEIDWETATPLEIKNALQNVASPKKCYDAIMVARGEDYG